MTALQDKPPTPRARRRADRLKSIREAAMALIVEEGLDSFSVHRLAERVDLTVGALYRYFSSVDQILIAVQVDVLEEFGSFLDRFEASRGDDSGIDRIWALVQAYIAWSRLQPQRFRLISRFVSTPEPVFEDTLAQQAIEPTLRLLGRLSAAFSATDGQLSEGVPLTRAILLWSGIHGMIERQKLNRLQPDLFPFDALQREFVAVMLRGWGADAQAVDDSLSRVIDINNFKKILSQSAQ